ncbi:NAD(P)H-binding protein [Hoeflea olei]|uniref:NAD(P)H-binding protein n=1 Tax=Hoeflea olei TaxID=1480615 RepID=UPI0009F568BB|nr:NAD(P)H-binding protein [Hoeflea olei]
MFGATGTIGRATVKALVDRGHEVVCFLRSNAGFGVTHEPDECSRLLHGALLRFGDVTDPVSVNEDGFHGEKFDVVVSCLASRNGVPEDAWAIDYQAHVNVLKAARDDGVEQFVLLSAICVQKPMLEFQKAKLAFEAELMQSGMDYSIVRPTAFFKSLSGQVERVKHGKAFLVFGDGRLTACKPISDRDLGNFIADCLDDPDCRNRILPIGGPGPAITPREQGEYLCRLMDREPDFKHVPVALLDVVIFVLSTLGLVSRRARVKAELARIGRYYATESMLVLDPKTGRYDADATPSTGSDTLFGFYDQLVRGKARVERGEHAVF